MATVTLVRGSEIRPFIAEEGRVLATIVVGGRLVSNPTLEMMYADGWQEYVAPAPTLDDVKSGKIAEIESYDTSNAVNEFYIGEDSLWLDKAMRTGLSLRIDAETAAGKTATTLWYGTQSYTLPVASARQLLYALEVYASECYDNTARHKAAIEAMTDIEAVREYDITAGYPEKIRIEL